MLEPGDEVPTFTLTDQSGEKVNLSDYEGQWVVLYFYPRADTPGCTTEACEFRDEWDVFSERNIAVLGISDDPVTDLASFANKYDLPFRLLSDEDGEVAEAFDSYKEKQVFGNTVMGVIRNTFVINPRRMVHEIYQNVSPDGHAMEILEDIPADE